MSLNTTIKSLSKTMDDMGISEIDFERRFLFGLVTRRIRLSKRTCVSVDDNAQDRKISIKKNDVQQPVSGHVLKSPMVGVVYLASEPGAKPFVKVGSKVNVGDTVALVEAMKTFNPIKSDVEGVVKKVMVEDGAAVEFDQSLIIIE